MKCWGHRRARAHQAPPSLLSSRPGRLTELTELRLCPAPMNTETLCEGAVVGATALASTATKRGCELTDLVNEHRDIPHHCCRVLHRGGTHRPNSSAAGQATHKQSDRLAKLNAQYRCFSPRFEAQSRLEGCPRMLHGHTRHLQRVHVASKCLNSRAVVG